VWTFAVATILALVIVGSILNQFGLKRWEQLVARYDSIQFLPYWGFFAPDPGHAGNHLVYRDRTSEKWCDWQEIPIPPRTSSEWIWNPGRFERKALLDLINGFARTQDNYRRGNALQLSLAYLAMLAWVMAQPQHDGSARARQFAVVTTTGLGADRQIRIAIVSAEHALD
jgi:hypothetical protein